MDRLDFTVIKPAVNEVARIEALAEPLGRKVLISPPTSPPSSATDAFLSRSHITSCVACATHEKSTGSILPLKD